MSTMDTRQGVLTTKTEHVIHFFPYGWPKGIGRGERVACEPPKLIVPGKAYRIVNFDRAALTASIEEVPDDERDG